MRPSSVHQSLVNKLCADGWASRGGRGGWLKHITPTCRRAFTECEVGMDSDTFEEEMQSCFYAMSSMRPDAWRVDIERVGTLCYPVAHIRFAEIEITNPLDAHKLHNYGFTCALHDAGEWSCMSVYVVDRHGFMQRIVSDIEGFADDPFHEVRL